MTMVGAEPKPASRLYLQLSQDHRVSRSFRATWFLRRLIQPFERQQEGIPSVCPASDDLSVLSSVGGDQVTPTTELIYICHCYSLVFVLDMGPTMMAVSNRTFKVKVDEAVSSLCACLQLLARPFQVPGSSVQLKLQLCVSVLAYCSTASKPIHVLLQGVHLHEGNHEKVTDLLRGKIRDYETTLAQGSNENRIPKLDTEDAANHGNSSLEGMVKAGTLGIQLLPRNALKGLILLTDGIPGFSKPIALLSTVSSMRGANISCWVVHVGGPPDPATPFGLLPDIETLQFMASACNGCVLQPDKILSTLDGLREGSLEPNAVQQAVLFWTFQRSARQWRIGGVVGGGDKGAEDLFSPIMHRMFQMSNITAPLLCVIGCRIREGFFVKDIAIRNSTLEVYLYYPWQPSVTIYYTVIAPFPVSNSSTHLQVTTSYDGPYSFVHDIHCERNSPITSTYRMSAVRKFKHFLKMFTHSDGLMIHFLAFATTPSYHTLPQAILDGMPLFYLPPNQSKPEPSVALSGSGDKKPKESPLINFWRPFCSIDTTQWFHWFHTNKIILVLQQDSFLPRNLLTPSSSGRYATLQCRLAASRIFAFLKSWSSFILLESHSFVRFLPLNAQPQYFCLIRVAQKHPCVVMHLAYVEGTPHSLQSQMFYSLCLSLRELSMAGGERTPGHTHKRRSIAAQRRKPCATVIDKQLQRVMIRYDNAPVTPLQSLSADSERLTQMEYLSCSNWQWDVPFPDPTIAIALLRLRLKEGFHLTSAHNGVVTLTAQLTLEQPSSPTQLPMLLQYVVFPSGDPPSSELWVEPQYGTICQTPPGLGYLMGLSHEQISAKVYAVDRKLVTAVASFLYLNHAPKGLLETSSNCSIPFDLSSLLPKARVLGFTLAAFSEVSSEKSLDLSSCSQMNREFREELINELSPLAPTKVPLPSSRSLLERLTSSQSLGKLCDVCGITDEDSNTRGWQCFSLGQEGSIVLFFIPSYFSRHEPSDEDGGDQARSSPSAFVFPVILLHCSQDLLIDPDPAQLDPFVIQPDTYQHLPFSNPETTSLPPLQKSSNLPPNISKLVSKLSVLHRSSYLHTIHRILQRDLPIQPKDFITALGICEKTVHSINCTPLIAALCQHTVVTTLHGEGEGSTSPLPTELLCQLHRAVSSKQPSSCRLSPRNEEPTSSSTPLCKEWREEIEETFQRYVEKLGFLKVPECAGYYWLSRAKEGEEDLSSEGMSEASEELTLPPVEETEEDEGGIPEATFVSSPASEHSTLRQKPSLSFDDEQLSQISTDIPDRASTGRTPSSGGEMGTLSPLLSPLLGLSTPMMPKAEGPLWPAAPLFLHVTCTVRSHGDQQEGNVACAQPCLPVCLKSVLADPAPSGSYSISLDLVFLSFSPEAQRNHTHETTPNTLMESPLLAPQTALPPSHHSIAVSLRQKVEWLIADELISASRVATPISPTLLQAVATHVQTSRTDSCFSLQVPLKFVFGPTHSMSHFILQLETIEVPMYSIVKVDEYYYLAPRPRPQSATRLQDHTPDPVSPIGGKLRPHSGERSKTPPPILKAFKEIARGHRRSVSCGYPPGHVPHLKSPASIPPSIQLSSRGSLTSVGEDDGVVDEDMGPVRVTPGTVSSGYEAGRSNSSSTGGSEVLLGSMDGERQEEGCGFWLVLRVLQDQAEVYFQLRSSQQAADSLLKRYHSLCSHVENAVIKTCHHTNQWFLLKDMLETRNCSPLLLAESPQEAWVEEVVRGRLPREPTPTQLASFRPQEFQCDQQWRKHLTPHWRIKDMKNQAALRITRMALNAFAVSNRKDVYVLQDVRENGEETIFYLRIDESLCRVEDDGHNLEESVTDGHSYDRSETRATVEIDSLSSFSYQQSISEQPELDRRATIGSLELPGQVGKPQESLVLELYGLTKPSLDLLERLSYIIQQKLDDSALEIMCSLYARNQKLKLTPADVQFLQPPLDEASHILNISLPSWVQEPQAFAFYYIQTMSTIALKPKYISSSDTREKFQVPLELQNAYVTTGLSVDIHQDHLFLYIRPHTQGRGMAVICVSLVGSSGHVIAPQPGIVKTTPGGCGYGSEMDLEQATDCQIAEEAEEHPSTGGYSLRLHIWEKGNVGMADLSRKLASCYKHTVCDYLLELCLLPLPISQLDERFEVVPVSPQSTGSPFILLEMPSDSPFSTPTKKRPDTTEDESSIKTFLEQDKASLGSLSRMTSTESPSDTSAENSLRSSLLPQRSRKDTERIIAELGEAMQSTEVHSIQEQAQEGEGGASLEQSLTWPQKEKLRREMEAQEAMAREAHLGNCGVLEESYHTIIPNHLARTRELGSSSVTHYCISLIGSYSAAVFLSQATADVHQLCPDITLNAFTYTDGDLPQYVHCTPEKDLTKAQKPPNKISKLRYIVIGRNPLQWEESLHPTVPLRRISQPWLDPQTKQSLQLFHPLDTKKPLRTGELPLQIIAATKSTFVPRQRLVQLIITNEKADLWLYNVSDELSARLRNRLTQLGEWQQTRAGFLHHVLSQKMGLFQHSSGRDVQQYTKMASKHCNTIQDISQLVKHAAPVSNETTPSRFSSRPPVSGQVAMETFYQEIPPNGPTQNTADAVYNHGQQFRATYHHQRNQIDARELLGKVFQSWQRRMGDSSAPVSSASISSLKRMARLLHYCTTPLLMQRSLVPQAEGQTSADAKPGAWFDNICEEFLSFYIEYLKSLGFHSINERPSLQPSRQRGSGRATPTRSHTSTPISISIPTHSPKLYKCLQRSWPGGIILIELSFQVDMFHVKLFTLESSRLVDEATISSEVHSLFSGECARYKDYIHVHSSMHDFHLRLLHSLVTMTRPTPEHFDIGRFLELFHKQYQITPNFIRSRLCKDVIKVPVTVAPAELYHHIVAHCNVFGMQTLVLQPDSPSANPEDICLFIHVSPKSLGPTTTPQLSKLLHDTQENYSIHILAMYEPQSPDDRAKIFKMIFYLLLVNKRDSFPRLTCDSPHLSASRHPVPCSTPLGSPEGEGMEESAFHLNVRQHRRKLGFGSLSSPSAASQMVLSESAIEDQMRGLQIHLENLVNRAQCHMRRDELWKRMLYGRPKSEGRPSSVHFESLTCTEFRELLQLVTVCPLESLDQHLAPLKKQTKKWFRKLMAPLEVKFAQSIRIYCSEDDCYRFAAIINPEWQDMFVMVQSDKDGRHQGFSAVYRKPQEGGVPLEERTITAHVEADQQHIEAVINFACSFLWASILDTSPPQPHLSLL